MKRKLGLTLSILALFLIAGCVNGSFVISQPPIINVFYANPEIISPGDSTTLNWNVTGAVSVLIDYGIGQVTSIGTRTVSPGVTTIYTLTATNSYGNSTATSQVLVNAFPAPTPTPTPTPIPTPTPTPIIVQPPPIINMFSANPLTISAGGSSTLSWNVANASYVYIDSIGTVTPAGSTVVYPATTTIYRLVAVNSAGTVTASAQVTVSNPTVSGLPVINQFIATPTVVFYGGIATLTWSTSNASSVFLQGFGPVPLHGSKVVEPNMTTSYLLSATNVNGTVYQYSLVIVILPQQTSSN